MKSLQYLILFAFTTQLLSCLKQKNELPNTIGNYDPELAVNYTLKELNAFYPTEGKPIKIDSDWTIACIVRADDESGNFYNQLIVEDSTAGMALLLNDNNLFNRYPVGRKLYLKIKGLYLGNYHGTLQLGADPAPDNSGILQVSDIPAKLLGQYIVAANMVKSTAPISVSIDDLSSTRKDLLNRLVMLEEAEISNPNYDNVYADASAATSIKIQNCIGTTMVLRSSNYARFQNYPTPWGKGKITGIYTVYNAAPQIAIRDTNDVLMGDIRCDGSRLSTAPIISIDSVRKMYQGKDSVLGNYKIRAVVTSDVDNKNFGMGNVILQSGGKGIMIYFGSSVGELPQLGDSIELNIAGATLTQYTGIIEIKNIKTSKVTVLAKNISVPAISLDIATLNNNFADYESLLVKIPNAKITNSGNYSGSKTLSDGTGSIILFTSSSATFAATAVPTITKTFQGIATPYNGTNEIKIRNPAIDVY